MDISPLQRKVTAASLPLDQLAGNTQIPQQEKIAEISRQFEAVLLRQILSDAQKNSFGADKKEQNSSAEIYKDMVTTQLADRISHSGGFGLANALQSQLGKQMKLPAKASPGVSGAGEAGKSQL